MSSKKSKKDQDSNINSGYNQWDFARDFSNKIFELFNNGNVYLGFLLLIILLMGLIIFKLPGSDLAELIREFFSAVRTQGFSYAMLFITNGIWILLFLRSQSIFQGEINRLTKLRSELMHKNDRIPIEEHRSSEDDQEEGYILPETTIHRTNRRN